MKLLLDEHFPSAIAEQLRGRGHDAVGVTEDPECWGLSDDDVFQLAAVEGRIVVTENLKHFAALHAASLTAGETHCGLVLTTNRRFPREPDHYDRLVLALGHLLRTADQREIAGCMVWLKPAP